MKKVLSIIVCAFAAIVISGCEDNLHIVFTDYYVCIKDENESEKSTVSAEIDGEVFTYYVSLVSTPLDEDLLIDYEVIAGDGLVEGVDYKMQRSTRTLTMTKGVYKVPVRVIFYKHQLDPNKDNTLTIRLTGTSKESLTIGYPGPSKKFSQHVITKVN